MKLNENVCVAYIFHNQTNINCKKCNIATILIFCQFTPMYLSKNLLYGLGNVMVASSFLSTIYAVLISRN